MWLVPSVGPRDPARKGVCGGTTAYGTAMTIAAADSGTWSGPSARLATLRHVEAGAVTAVALLAGVGAALAAGSGLAAGVVAVAVVVAGAVADRLLVRRVRAWGFATRDDDLLVRRGVLFRRLSVIPYGRMQFVDVTAGPLERAFGLASLHMHTAAAASDARVPGLAAADATRLRDELSRLGEARAAGL